MNPDQLKKDRAKAIDDAKAVTDKAKAENRSITEAEEKQIGDLLTKADELRAQINRAEERAALVARVAKEAAELDEPAPRKVDPDEVRATPDVQVGAPEWTKDPKKGFRSLGHLCMDIVAESNGRRTSREYQRWQDHVQNRTAGSGGLIVALTSEGGVLVPDGFVQTLLEKPFRENPMLSQLQQIPITAGNTISIPYINESSRATGSRQGGVRVYRDAELEAMTASKPGFGQLKLVANAMTGFAYVSDDMLRFSSVSVEPLLTRLFQREFSFAICNEIINGTGANGQLQGILNAACLVTVNKETGQAATTIAYNNVAKMWARRHVASGPYCWCINQDTFPQLSTMSIPVGTGGVAVWMPAGGAAGLPYATLFGAPVVEMEQAATLGTVGDIILCAPGEYIYAPVPGFDAAASIHLKFDYRQTAFRFVLFNAGAPWWSSALTPYKGASNTQSPFVALQTRS